MKIIIICVFSLGLYSCMSFPKSSDELQTTSATRQDFTTSVDPEDIERRLDTYLARCYDSSNKPNIYLNHAKIGVDQGFNKTKSENSIKYSTYIGNPPKFYNFDIGVEIDKISSISTIKLVGSTGVWRRHFSKIENVVNGENIHCPL